MPQEQQQLYLFDDFKQRLPAWCWASNHLDKGQRVMRRDHALHMAYVNPNPKAFVNVVIFDCDYAGAGDAWMDAGLPEPSWTSVNPRGLHAHLAYALAHPISRTPQARQRPIRALARIEEAMTELLGADRCYGHGLTHTPDHKRWSTLWGPRAYELKELRACLDENLPPPAIHRATATGVGRNCTLFDDVRRWAYRARRRYTDHRRWDAACLATAEALNKQFRKPLPYSEVRSVARSVAKYTWPRYTAEAFAARQAALGKRGGRANMAKRQAELFDIQARIIQCQL